MPKIRQTFTTTTADGKQAKLLKLAEKALKRQQKAEKAGNSKPFSATQWKKKKAKNKTAKKSRKYNR